MLTKRNLALIWAICSMIFLSGCLSSGGPTATSGWGIEGQKKNLHATIQGRAIHNSKGIPSAKIQVRGTNLTTTTNRNGNYTLKYDYLTNVGVISMRIQIIVSADSYESQTRSLTVQENRTSEIDIKLLPATND